MSDFEEHLFELNRRSAVEGFSPPPNFDSDAKLAKRTKPFYDSISSSKLLSGGSGNSGHPARLAAYLRIACGGGSYADARDEHRARGSHRLLLALEGVRFIGKLILEHVQGCPGDEMPEDHALAMIAITMFPTCQQAYARARRLPIVTIGCVEIPTPLVKCAISVITPRDAGKKTESSNPATHGPIEPDLIYSASAVTQAKQVGTGRGGKPIAAAASPLGRGGGSPGTSTPTASHRALIAKSTLPKSRPKVPTISAPTTARTLLVDSGCNRHTHNRREDLVNFRSMVTYMTGAVTGSRSKVLGIGDLPVVAKDTNGNAQPYVIKGVRLITGFDDCLISVSALKFASGTTFDSGPSILRVPGNPPVQLPLRESDGMYEWELASLTADAPKAAATGRAAPDESWATANANRHSHRGDNYKPSFAGRMVHCDLAGPFRASAVHGYRYMLVCVDDHARFKRVYFLKRKNESLRYIKRYVAAMRAYLNVGKSNPVNVTTSVHTDGGGEFISREFSEFTDYEGVDHTTCPPYVHDLNGVAERAIRTIMEMVRAALVLANSPVSFWPFAAEHVVDILNRTTCPPRSTATSHEHVTGSKPKILPIMPFGCRAYAVKPRAAYNKEDVPARSWVGINLGKSLDTPGSYLSWLPDQHKYVNTSDVWFDETLMPWRPRGEQRVGPAPLVRAPIDDSVLEYMAGSSGGAEADATAPRLPLPSRKAGDADFEAVASASPSPARSSNKVLILFNGMKSRPDGLAAFLLKAGFECELVDNDPISGSGPIDDLHIDAVFERFLKRIQSGEFCCVVAAPPCSTYSVARFFECDDAEDGGPPPVRNRDHLLGLPGLPPSRLREVTKANSLTGRTAALLLAAHRAGAFFILENPADRGDMSSADLFLHEKHAPLWLMPEIVALEKLTDAETVTFPLGAFGAEWRKDTTLMFSPGLARWLRPLSGMRCPPSIARKPVGGVIETTGGRRRWRSAEAAAYPTNLNLYLSAAISRSVFEPSAAPMPKVGPVAPRGDPVLAPVLASLQAPRATDAPSAAVEAVVQPAVATAGTAPAEAATDDPGEAPADAAPPSPAAPTPAKRKYKRKESQDHFQRGLGPVPTRSSALAPGRALLVGRLPTNDWKYRDETSRALKSLGNSTGSIGRALTAAEESNGQFTPTDPSPANRREAMATNGEGWSAAEKKELSKHVGPDSNESFEWLDRSQLPRGRSLVKLVWVYKVKRDGTLKARLCVQGCSQVAGVDYDQTHCATMRPSSLRYLASLSARLGLRMRRWDFASAYLQGVLESGEDVYCYAPQGYGRVGSDGRPQICRVVKPIYGMAQAGRRWQRTMFEWFREHGFEQLHGDNCVFIKRRGDEVLVVGTYVDDLACCFSADGPGSLYAEFVEKLNERFEVEDEGDLTDLLAVEFCFLKSNGVDGAEGTGSIKLHQQTYVQKLVREFGSIASEPSHQGYRTPCDVSIDKAVADSLADPSERDPADVKAFQRMVASFLYLSVNTRPDIAYAVGMLCRCMARPTPELFAAARRVLGYLEKTADLGLIYTKDSIPLHGMSDSDWAVKHSTTGWVFMFNGAAVSWASLKQPCVALSSCEAEIIAASEAAKEGKFWGTFLADAGYPLSDPLEISVDNTAARDLAYNPEHHKRTKHIDRRHFFIRELVENHIVRVPFVPTENNLADMFTKALDTKRFIRLRSRVMGHGSDASAAFVARGGVDT